MLQKGLRNQLEEGVHILYVSPLKALSNDIQRNLDQPLDGIAEQVHLLGLPPVDIRVGVRTGDTPASERQKMARHPPHILVTTPESLYLLLTSASGRAMLATVTTVIVDEIHALLGDKRGSHLALSLERLQLLCRESTGQHLQRIGLSATQRPIEMVARYLVGGASSEEGTTACEIVDSGFRRKRDLRIEVPERMDYAGRVVTPLDEDAVRAVGAALLARGAESVVIHFLHAYANPDHEIQAAEVLSDIWPNSYITMGHGLLSESREFERGVTAAVNASVQPLLERYVKRLATELAGGGYGGELLVMNGNGGTVSASRVVKEAAKTVMSGPASGVIAAAYTGRRASRPNLISYDMGGTSTDVALIRDCRPSVSNEIEIEYAMPIHVPMVDVRTIGAGGGSIARVNEAGLLEVGPRSAGADPGPICYGRGGELPTISDANMVLGRLDVGKLKSVPGLSLIHI